MKYIATIDDQSFEIEINERGEILLDGERLPADFMPVAGQSIFSLLLDDNSFEAHLSPTDEGLEVLVRGKRYMVAVEDERARLLRRAAGGAEVSGGEFQLKAPMPGLIVEVLVEEGQQVEKGENLVILESMKMQNELKAPRAGTISRVRVGKGDSVTQNTVMVVIS